MEKERVYLRVVSSLFLLFYYDFDRLEQTVEVRFKEWI